MPISIPTSIAGISVPGTINGPLELLYGNKYVRTDLRYPRNLGSDATRNHIIQFISYKPTEGYISQVGTNIVALGGAIGAGVDMENGGTAFVQSVANMVDNVAANGIPENVSSATATFYKDIVKADIPRQVDSTIALYIPDTVNVTYGATYDEIGLTESLGKAYFLAQAGTSMFDLFKQSGDKNKTQLANQIANDPYVASAAANFLGKAIGASNLGDLVTRSMGQAINPQLQVLFRGVDFRRFQFDFVFTPYSSEETEAVKKIIYAFKHAAAPEITSTKYFAEGGLFFKVPYPFDIKFFYKGQENTYVHKIGRCVLENINVDYGPNGWATFNDGSPVQIKMTLQFKETVIVDKQRIKEGF
jgi:hypothetical protein